MERRRAAEFASLRQIGAGRSLDRAAGAEFSTLAVFHAWTRTVGPQLRRVTRPLEWDGRRLVVEVRDPIWLGHLDRMRGDLLPRLNASLSQGGPGRSGALTIDEVILTPGPAGEEEARR